MGVVKLSTAGILDYSKTSNFLSGNAPVSFGAFDLLETTTLTSSASSVTFSGLDAYSGYKHLQIRAVTRPEASRGLLMRMNGAISGYAAHQLRGTGSAVQVQAFTDRTSIDLTEPIYSVYTNEYAPIIVDILDFNSTTKDTTIRALYGNASSDNTNDWIGLTSGLLASTAAITSASFFYNGVNHTAKTRFSLYGVK